ncbi:MAG TPA: ABC transporter substrate-binding protein [Clostridiaceae bacterium]|nr:ABC transporter substrate-binding protein [Clostridiaceae bacterium]
MAVVFVSLFFIVGLVMSYIPGKDQNNGAVVRVGLLRVPNDEILAKATNIIDERFAEQNIGVEYITFDSGVDANKALSADSIDFASMGHTNGVVALSNNINVELIWIHEILGDVEALVARDDSGIETIEDLRGKRIATTFASTSHLSLLTILQNANLEDEVTLLDMQTADIVAAWRRGDIDAAYTWQPSLGEIMKTGTTLKTSAQMAEEGLVTCNILLANKNFTDSHPDLTVTFLSCLKEAGDIYRADPDQAASILAQELTLDIEEVKIQLQGSQWLTPQEALSDKLLGTHTEPGSFVDVMKNTADFLYNGRYIQRNPSREEIARFVNPVYVEAMYRGEVMP